MFVIRTDLSPSEALQHIQSFMNAQDKGWTLTHKDNDSITFTRTGKPKILVTLLLLFLWIVPGVLYLIFAWRKETANFFVGKRKEGIAITVEAGLHSVAYGKSLMERLRSVTDQVETDYKEGKLSILKNPSLNAAVGVVIIVVLITVFFVVR